MVGTLPGSLRGRSRRRSSRLLLEELESRHLPSGVGLPGLLPVPEVEPNDTLDLAQDLGDISITGQAAVVGTLAAATPGSGDVDWFQFTLSSPARVTLPTQVPDGAGPVVPLGSVLSLYNNDPFNFFDPANTTGHRLLDQAEGSSNTGARIEQALGVGTYWVAVSDGGNRYFHPFLADSGSPGVGGDYELTLTADPLVSEADAGPSVLGVSPADGAILDDAPLVLRVQFDTALDPGTVDPSSTAQLLFSPSGDFSDPSNEQVPLAWYNFSTTADELQLAPAAALQPGSFRIFLAGDTSSGAPVLADLNGNPLGMDALHPTGQDVTLSFQINGSEGSTVGGGTADDSSATAHELGDLISAGQVQVAGVIGDDPAYDPNSADPLLTNPASDVDMYHFQISGPGRYALAAEVFAGRIGSRLDPGVSVFRLEPSDGQLHLIDGNDNTLNNTPSTNGMYPLFTDALLETGLTAGDYYVAVSSSGNTPERDQDLLPGINGIFDPNTSHSGTAGNSIGPYVLSLSIRPDTVPPRVIAVTPSGGTILTAAPTSLTVQFSEAVNLQQLAYQAYQETVTGQDVPTPVFIVGPDGRRYFPRLESYDPATNQAQFLMLDGLTSGTYQLHFSGANGLTDLAGNPLTSNGPSGDYVVSFTVIAPLLKTVGDPHQLGVLFPNELVTGVTVVRDQIATLESAAPDGEDDYQFEVLQDRTYVFVLDGPGDLGLLDSDGNPVSVSASDSGEGIQAQLAPGSYTVSVSGWTQDQSGQAAYKLNIGLGESGENPPPLTVGPRPASSLSLFTLNPATAPVDLPRASPVLLSPTIGPPQAQPSGDSFPVSTGILAVAILSRSAAPGGEALATVSPAVLLATAGPGTQRAMIPAGLLTSLSAGPVGGVEDAAASDLSVAADRARAEALEPFLLDNLLRVAGMDREMKVANLMPPSVDIPRDTLESLLFSPRQPMLDAVWSSNWMLEPPVPVLSGFVGVQESKSHLRGDCGQAISTASWRWTSVAVLGIAAFATYRLRFAGEKRSRGTEDLVLSTLYPEWRKP